MSGDRSISVDAEIRSITVSTELRSVVAAAESRTVRVKTETRAITVDRGKINHHGSHAARNLIVGLFGDSDTFYPSVVVRDVDTLVVPPLYADADAFYSAIVAATNDLTPSLFDDDDTFYDHLITLVGVDQDLTPSLFTDADTFYTAVVGAALGIQPALFADDDTFNAPTATSSATLAPSLFVDADTFYTAQLDPFDLRPALLVDADTFYAAVVALVVDDLAPSLYVEADTFYVATVTATRDLTPSLFVDGDTFYTPRISDFILLPALFTDSDVFPPATVTSVGGFTNSLPQVAWDGGPAYYSQFSKAASAGWTSASFFPIGVFLSPTQDPFPARLASAGVNYYMGVEHNPPLANVTNNGVATMQQIQEWTVEEVGTNALSVSWFIADEPDMNESYGDQYGRLAAVQSLVSTSDSRNDGRFSSLNIGNGICRSYWCPDTIDEMIQAVDFCSSDKYAYTSPGSRFEIERSPDWPGGSSQCAAAYGWQARQMRKFQDPNRRRPFGVVIETARPLLGGESGTSVITIPQIGGAVWSAIINEARSVVFFQHNDAPGIDFYSLSGGTDMTIHDGVAAITAKVKSLAPVINTQSYVWDFGSPNMDTMLKADGGFAYLFAIPGIGATLGSKMFTLPTGISGASAEVVGENRSVPVSAGKLTDSFVAEYTSHVYKILI